MPRLTWSLYSWLFINHKDIVGLILMGHLELLTEEMYQEYLEWVQTDEGREYLAGGSKYNEEYAKKLMGEESA